MTCQYKDYKVTRQKMTQGGWGGGGGLDRMSKCSISSMKNPENNDLKI